MATAYCALVVLGKKRLWIGFAALLLGQAASAFDFELRLQSAGVRGGWAATTHAQAMREVDAFGDWEMPWRWEPGGRFYIQPQFEAAAGCLNGHGDSAFVGKVGPDLSIGWRDFPLTFQVGTVPTLISRHTFGGKKNLGSNFQFTSYVGFDWNFYDHWQLGYRFQHMSNAGLATPNPGLNLHMVSLSWLF